MYIYTHTQFDTSVRLPRNTKDTNTSAAHWVIIKETKIPERELEREREREKEKEREREKGERERSRER